MTTTALVSTRIPPQLADRLAKLAKITQRSKSFLAAQAIEEFVNLQEWQVQAIREGMAAVERGELASHEQALAILELWGKDGKN